MSSASIAWRFSWDQASDTQLKPSNSPSECLGLGSGDTSLSVLSQCAVSPLSYSWRPLTLAFAQDCSFNVPDGDSE